MHFTVKEKHWILVDGKQSFSVCHHTKSLVQVLMDLYKRQYVESFSPKVFVDGEYIRIDVADVYAFGGIRHFIDKGMPTVFVKTNLDYLTLGGFARTLSMEHDRKRFQRRVTPVNHLHRRRRF